LAQTAAFRDDRDSATGPDAELAPGRPRQVGLPKLLLTPEEAAHVLGIGRTKLYQLLADGQLPSVRIGGSRRVSTDALSRFVQGLEPVTAGQQAARI
jgi:excisionase family DNA binding protein